MPNGLTNPLQTSRKPPTNDWHPRRPRSGLNQLQKIQARHGCIHPVPKGCPLNPEKPPLRVDKPESSLGQEMFCGHRLHAVGLPKTPIRAAPRYPLDPKPNALRLLATAETAATPPHRQGLPNGHQPGTSPLHAGSSESIGQTVSFTPSACTITSSASKRRVSPALKKPSS